jgi:hypothetical protein
MKHLFYMIINMTNILDIVHHLKFYQTESFTNWHVKWIGKTRNSYKILVGKSQGKTTWGT